jgi:hypothetical protein
VGARKLFIEQFDAAAVDLGIKAGAKDFANALEAVAFERPEIVGRKNQPHPSPTFLMRERVPSGCRGNLRRARDGQDSAFRDRRGQIMKIEPIALQRR